MTKKNFKNRQKAAVLISIILLGTVAASCNENGSDNTMMMLLLTQQQKPNENPPRTVYGWITDDETGYAGFQIPIYRGEGFTGDMGSSSDIDSPVWNVIQAYDELGGSDKTKLNGKIKEVRIVAGETEHTDRFVEVQKDGTKKFIIMLGTDDTAAWMTARFQNAANNISLLTMIKPSYENLNRQSIIYARGHAMVAATAFS